MRWTQGPASRAEVEGTGCWVLGRLWDQQCGRPGLDSDAWELKLSRDSKGPLEGPWDCVDGKGKTAEKEASNEGM